MLPSLTTAALIVGRQRENKVALFFRCKKLLVSVENKAFCFICFCWGFFCIYKMRSKHKDRTKAEKQYVNVHILELCLILSSFPPLPVFLSFDHLLHARHFAKVISFNPYSFMS